MKLIYGVTMLQILYTAIASPDIVELKGEPDFRSIKLSWKSHGEAARNSSPFLITYCEDQAWGKHRCRKKVIINKTDRKISQNDDEIRENFVHYETRIRGLRMATNYTVEIGTTADEQMSDANKRGRALAHDLFIQTKGFYARAINCLANSSLVEIETGPYFGGKISVEGSNGNECYVQGNMSSPRTSYILSIDHFRCGSEVRNTSVKTYMIVQENVPILTHSTRRFMIICRYVPATFTVRAGVNLPDYDEPVSDLIPVGKDIFEVDPLELFDSTNSLFSSRVGKQVGRALKFSAKKDQEESEKWAHLVLMVILIMAGVIGISFAIFYFVAQSRRINGRGSSSHQSDDSVLDSSESISENGGLEEVLENDDVDFYAQIGPSFCPGNEEHPSLTEVDFDIRFHTNVANLCETTNANSLAVDISQDVVFDFGDSITENPLFDHDNQTSITDDHISDVERTNEAAPDESLEATINDNVISESAISSFSDFIPSSNSYIEERRANFQNIETVFEEALSIISKLDVYVPVYHSDGSTKEIKFDPNSSSDNNIYSNVIVNSNQLACDLSKKLQV